jgi:putative transposase
MSRAGNVYDNAFMESCFGTFKTELEMTEYESCRDARREIAEYIAYYRSERKHSALGVSSLTSDAFRPKQTLNRPTGFNRLLS